MKKRISPFARHTLLASAALLAIGAAPAGAQSLYGQGSYSFGQYDGVGQWLSLDGYATALSTAQENGGFVAATTAGLRFDTQLANAWSPYGLQSGMGDGTAITQAGNRITALALGNQNSSDIDLGQQARRIDGNDGVAALVGQLRSNAASRSLVVDSGVSTRVQNMPAAQQVVTGNTIAAETALNQSATSITGPLPSSYGEGAAAGVQTTIASGYYEGSSVSTQSSAAAAVTTAQVAVAAGSRAGSGASVVNSRVELDVAQQGYAPPYQDLIAAPVALAAYSPYPQDTQVSASLELAGNKIGAGHAGNRATSGIASQGAAAVSGSVAVSNTQANIGSGWNDLATLQSSADMQGSTAQVIGASVTATVRSHEGGRADLTGSLAVTGNTLSAEAIGNAATGAEANGARGAGNSIVISAASVDAAGWRGINQAGADHGRIEALTAAGIVLANAQSNHDERLTSELAYSGVGASVDNIAGHGAVALDRNTLAAAATGNIAGNLVQVDAVRIGASVAASNSQGNGWTEIGAVAGDVGVRASIGNYGNYGSEVSGSTSVSSNLVGSTATGNAADTRIALSAAQFAGSGEAAGARSTTRYGALASAGGDVSAVNAQSNTGGSIESGLFGASVGAEFTGQGYYGYDEGAGGASLRGANVAVDGNTLRSQAVGNDAATGIALAGGASNASAAVANRQQNAAAVDSSVRYSGVAVTGASLGASTVSLAGNSVAAAGVGNRSDNRVSAAVSALQAPAGYEAITDDGVVSGIGASTGRGDSSAVAALSLTSTQSNGSATDARNLGQGALARVDIAGARYYDDYIGHADAAASDSSVVVKGNVGSAAASGNQVANALTLDAGAVSAGMPLAALANLQANGAENRSSAITGGPAGDGVTIGVRYDGALSASTIAVSDNVVSASNLGNTAGNTLAARGTSLAGGQGGAGLEAGTWGAGVRSDLSLVNQQVDRSAARLAETRNVAVGIDDERGSWGGVYGTDMTVAGNRNLAEARNNNAVNTVAATGFSSLNAGAGLANSQDSSTRVTASSEGAARIRARDTGVESATLAVAGNATHALAVANSASNAMVVDAQQVLAPLSSLDLLRGYDSHARSAVTAVDAGSLTSSAQFAVGNVQTQQGAVTANATGGARINLDDSGVYGSRASVTGNSLAAIAQSNSADNSLALSASAAAGASGVVASTQQGWGRVSATAQAQDSDKAFAIRAGYADGSQLSVSGNVVRAAAGQNEAFNRQAVTATTLAGTTIGYLPTLRSAFDGDAAISADHAVLNQQTGSGNVTAIAAPGLIGLPVGSSWGGSLAVTGNEVSARANVNQSSNALEIAAQGSLAATGVVSNAQSSQGGSTSALVGGKTATFIGAAAYRLDYGTTSVTGNMLNAAAAGNTTANVLNAASAGTSSYGSAASFQVLNQQQNTAGMNAAVQNATIGMALGFPHDVNGNLGAYAANAYGPGSMNGSTATIQGNQVQASAHGNTASNAIAVTGAGSNAALSNRQSNAASINATVSNVMVGIGGGQAVGSNGSVSGNSVSAQAVGNTATSAIRLK